MDSPSPDNPPVYGPSPPSDGVDAPSDGVNTVQDDGKQVPQQDASKEVMSPKAMGDPKENPTGDKDSDTVKQLMEIVKAQQEQIRVLTSMAQVSPPKSPPGATLPRQEVEYHSMASQDNISVAPSAEQYVDALNDNSNAMKKLQESFDKKEEMDKIHKSDVKLATFAIGQPGTRAILLENWLRDSKGKVSSMSDFAKSFWEKMISNVEKAYEQWSKSDPMERSSVVVEKIEDPKFSRIKPLVGNVMRDAQQNKVKEFILSMNLIEPEQILYYIYQRCGPGGPEERKAVLERISHPVEKDSEGKYKYPLTFTEAAKSLRVWNMCLERAKYLNISIPDPSVLWQAVLQLTTRALSIDEMLQHRVMLQRNTLDVDARPKEETALKLYHILLMEFDMRVDNTTVAQPGNDGAPPAQRPPKVDPKGKGKGKEKGKPKEDPTVNVTDVQDPKVKEAISKRIADEKARLAITRQVIGPPPPQQKGKGKGKPGKVPWCSSYNKTDEGCVNGACCTKYHPLPEQGRCDTCGGKHNKSKCTRKKTPGSLCPKVKTD